MDLGDYGKAAFGQAIHLVETLDDVQLPQRPIEIEGPRHESGDLDAELPPVTRPGQGDVPYVELQVEIGIVNPVGMIEVERHPHEALAEHPGLVKAAVDVGEDPLERHLAAGRGRRIVNRYASPGHMGPWRLRVEEGRVKAGQLPHGATSGFPSGGPDIIRPHPQSSPRRPLPQEMPRSDAGVAGAPNSNARVGCGGLQRRTNGPSTGTPRDTSPTLSSLASTTTVSMRDFGAEGLSDLDIGRSDTSRGADDQHGLSRGHMCLVSYGLQRGEPRHRDCGGLFEREGSPAFV